MENAEFEQLKLKNQLCFPLYAASRQVIKQYRPLLSVLDLTYTQYITMMVLWEEKMLNVKALGEKLYLDSGTLTPVLKCLESKDYVRRFRSAEDERVLMVEVTELGEALKVRAAAVPAQIAGCIQLSPEDAVQLHQLLYKVLDAMKEEERRD